MDDKKMEKRYIYLSFAEIFDSGRFPVEICHVNGIRTEDQMRLG
jgi:hypothetical protein